MCLEGVIGSEEVEVFVVRGEDVLNFVKVDEDGFDEFFGKIIGVMAREIGAEDFGVEGDVVLDGGVMEVIENVF